MEFWELLEVRMAWHPQTEEEAARDLDVRQPTFNRWRNGSQLPEVHRYPKLSQWLEIDMSAIGRAVDRQRLRQSSEKIARREARQRR